MSSPFFNIFVKMAKKKNQNKKVFELEFIPRLLEKKMFGVIPGIDLPKFYKDFTAEEKLALYWFNPARTKALFVDVSGVGPRELMNKEEKIEAPKNDEKEEQQNDEAGE